jgi:hypothetical protein
MTELKDDLSQFATDFIENLSRFKGHQAETPQAETLVVNPGNVLVIRIPSHSNRDDVAVFQNFIDHQMKERGISLPVLVVIADEVTVEKGL